jgi:methionine sulfoxide reductase heme-binding subunit
MPGNTKRRVVRHGVLALGSSLAVLVIFYGMSSRGAVFRLSMGTAYVSLALLVVTLMIGPLNVVRRRPNPVSTSFRRDVGIWSGITGLIHLVLGLNVHLRGNMEQYFVFPSEWGRAFPLRFDAFGIANWTGLLGGLILAILLGLSNDFSLVRLGTARWKSLQRSSYAVFVLLVIHGALYQLVVESRSWGWVLFFGAMVVVAGVAQATGFREVKAMEPE